VIVLFRSELRESMTPTFAQHLDRQVATKHKGGSTRADKKISISNGVRLSILQIAYLC